MDMTGDNHIKQIESVWERQILQVFLLCEAWIFPLHFDQLWVSGLISVYGKNKLLQASPVTAESYSYKDMYLGGSLMEST